MKTTSARFSAFVLLGSAALFVAACGDDASSVTAPPAGGGAAGKSGASGASAGSAGKGGAAGGGAGNAAKGGAAGNTTAGTGGAAGTGTGGNAGTGTGGTAGAGTAGTTNGGGAGGAAAGAAGTSAAGAAGSGTGGTSVGGNSAGGTAGSSAGGTTGAGNGGATAAGNGGTSAGGNGGTSAGGTDAGGNGGTSAGGTDAGGNGGASAGGTDAGGNGGTSAGGSAAAGNGGTSAGGSAGAGGSNPQARPNRMFVTSATVTLATFNGRSAGDALCQKLAQTAKLPNVEQYRAWLSDKTTDARQTLGNARGWVRTDGLPFADTVGDLANGKIFYPPRIDENGKDLGADIKVITGTKEDGTKAPNEICDGWVGTGNVRIGDGNRTTEAWTSSSSDGCSGTARLYCFETTHEVTVAPPAVPKTAKVIFVSRAAFLPGPGGRGTADASCAQEAKAAQLPGDYVALLPLGKEGALDRVPGDDLPWYRPDGVVVAKSDLKETRLTAPPNVTANGAGYIGSSRTIVTGIVGNFNAEPALQCVNWTKTEGDPASGVATVTARANETAESWRTAATDVCNHDKAAVYCVSKKP